MGWFREGRLGGPNLRKSSPMLPVVSQGAGIGKDLGSSEAVHSP